MDGVLQTTLKDNVPTEAGPWVWNVWTNGDPTFSAGPPKEDALFKIASVVMFFNTTAD